MLQESLKFIGHILMDHTSFKIFDGLMGRKTVLHITHFPNFFFLFVIFIEILKMTVKCKVSHWRGNNINLYSQLNIVWKPLPVFFGSCDYFFKFCNKFGVK